jgi:hypothetical protein
MPTYAVTVSLTVGDELDPALCILDALANRVEHIGIEPLSEDDDRRPATPDESGGIPGYAGRR